MAGRTLEEQAARVKKRLDELGLERVPVTPNSGRYRTRSKRALLTRIQEECRAAGKEPPFKGNFEPFK